MYFLRKRKFLAEDFYYASESTQTNATRLFFLSLFFYNFDIRAIESNFSKICYFMQNVELHKVRILVFDNLPKVSNAFKHRRVRIIVLYTVTLLRSLRSTDAPKGATSCNPVVVQSSGQLPKVCPYTYHTSGLNFNQQWD